MRRLALLLLLLPGLAIADTTQATFDIYVLGLKAGVLSISGEESATRYAAAGRLESAGLVGMVRPVRYDVEVRGRKRGDTYLPERYAERTRRSGDASRAVMEYRGGVPLAKLFDPPQEPDEEDLDPSTQAGTIDPMTAIWGMLRDAPEDQVCSFSAVMFDGARRSRIALSAPRRSDDGISCAGEYRRIAGFSDEDLAEKTRFPFGVRYRPAGDGVWRVERVEMDTLFGTGALVRR